MGNSARTVENHEKDQRPYIKLFSYFSDEELQEFVDTGKISKFDVIQKIEIEKLVLIEDLPFVQLYKKINGTKDEAFQKQMVLKNALFKVEQGLDKTFFYPLFMGALLEIDASSKDIFSELYEKVESMKLGILGHENHRRIVLEFIKKYMTSEELLLLKEYFSKNQ
jgi:hypothetical protein